MNSEAMIGKIEELKSVKQDLLAQIRQLLADPQRAEAIRQAGMRRARRDHTWEMRFDRIFRLMGLI